jgi:hypothetical protein
LEEKKMTAVEIGANGCTAIANELRAFGRYVRQMSYRSYYDLYVDGFHVEAKFANANPYNWAVGIARMRQLKEAGIDYYAVRLASPSLEGGFIHLLFKAPVRIKTIFFSGRTLHKKYASEILEYRKFRAGLIRRPRTWREPDDLLRKEWTLAKRLNLLNPEYICAKQRDLNIRIDDKPEAPVEIVDEDQMGRARYEDLK